MDYLLQLAASPTAWVALATLIVMEIVLGIDNLIFISILTNKLPEQHPGQGAAHWHQHGVGVAPGSVEHHRVYRAADGAGI
ncbi:hypothetical protein QF045_002489 [Pseudomonas sp. W4I3]|nr:hypothetical protein [Pseudomonas sp. W4I3]